MLIESPFLSSVVSLSLAFLDLQISVCKSSSASNFHPWHSKLKTPVLFFSVPALKY